MRKSRSKLLQIRGEIKKEWYVSGVIGIFMAFMVVWSLLSYSQAVDRTFLPTPDHVFQTFIKQVQTEEFWKHVGISVYRVGMGFLLACAIGIPLGILAGAFRFAEAVIVPATEFIRYMPATAFIPLIMVWAGIGETAKIMVIFIGSFFQLVLMVADNTRAVSNDLLQSSYTLGATEFQVVTRVLLPALMPDLMNTLRLIMGWAWTYLVVAELVAANSGLGFSIMKAQRFLNTDVIFVGIFVIGFLGLLTDRMFALANNRLFPWTEGGRS
ncbi:ABC transporter permease [Effusibacillus lacus]|uniref:Nitrate transport permease nrtB n=1 Tax=Effusibacillus lacus TaxID=1348429 RepID=A0A292YLR3_9BACL|nr:ABC transporter permease [Effusibacillus lacus]TCS71223.1 NitT/TauT family transport system permease protein [Effusibacillus lacus]GAX89849.1 nitrate transport permease nrtB [Effusibacillus lacus]